MTFLPPPLARGLILILAAAWSLPGAAQGSSMDQTMDHSKMGHSAMGAASMDAAGASAPNSMDMTTPSETPMDEMPDHGDAAHGDHNPKFGGLVLMYGLLHFEIVGRPEGGVELHLSDAMRVPMPAVTVSDVTIEIERNGGRYESVPMSVSEAGDYWSGPSAPLVDTDSTTVHLAFVAYGNPYVYALPLAALQPDDSAALEPAASGALAGRTLEHTHAD